MRSLSVVLLAFVLSASSVPSFACPFHHIRAGAVDVYKFVRPVTNPIAKTLYKIGKYIVS